MSRSRIVEKFHPDYKRQLKQALNELLQNPSIGKDLQEGQFGFKSSDIKNTGFFTRLTKMQNISKFIT